MSEKQNLPDLHAVRPEVAAFARLMEMGMRKHDGDWGDGYKEWEPQAAHWRLLEEADKLKQLITPPTCGCREAACEHSVSQAFWRPGPAEVGKRAANVANFAMMIAYMCSALEFQAGPKLFTMQDMQAAFFAWLDRGAPGTTKLIISNRSGTWAELQSHLEGTDQAPKEPDAK